MSNFLPLNVHILYVYVFPSITLKYLQQERPVSLALGKQINKKVTKQLDKFEFPVNHSIKFHNFYIKNIRQYIRGQNSKAATSKYS